MHSRVKRSKAYHVRLTPVEKAALERLADEVGVTVSDAMRAGAVAWLHYQLETAR